MPWDEHGEGVRVVGVGVAVSDEVRRGWGNGLAACARIQFSGRSLWAARTLPGHYVKMQQFCNDFTLL